MPDTAEHAPRSAKRSRRSGSGTGSEARRRYQQPSLRAYGKLVDVTRFGGSVVVDSGFGLGQA